MTDADLVLPASKSAAAAFDFRHPLDGSAGCRIAPMSRMAGLAQVAVNHVTVAPGEMAFPHHVHHGQEEWVFVISGEADVRLGEQTHRLVAGDFAAFPPGGPAHSVRNAGTGDLSCLMGGHAVPNEVIDFPDLEKRVVRTGAGLAQAPITAFAPFEAPAAEKT